MLHAKHSTMHLINAECYIKNRKAYRNADVDCIKMYYMSMINLPENVYFIIPHFSL